MAKQKKFGFKTPKRRATKNVTGNKVGAYTGGECNVIYTNRLVLKNTKTYTFDIKDTKGLGLFDEGIVVIAIGGYFICDKPIKIVFSINIDGNVSKVRKTLDEKVYIAIGHDSIVESDSKAISIEVKFLVSEDSVIDYTHFSYGFVNSDIYNNKDRYNHYFNSKRTICFPEQFYFKEHNVLGDSIQGPPIIAKSCNRCERFLPINPFNQRQQLAFSNHCVSDAPCKHSSFSNYTIKNNLVKDLNTKFPTYFDATYKYDSEKVSIHAHYGHQLECKACKKFLVNAALNKLRTSTQHREDSLRRRAIESLVRNLLNLGWIYHTYRLKTGKEFDKDIWAKFDKKCFKCGNPIAKCNQMDLDHTMPLSYLYALDETATCLCPTCNGKKSGIFPVDFYTPSELKNLSEITGLSLDILGSNKANQKVVNALKTQVKWFVDVFLKHEDYVQEREGKKAADSILHSVQKAVNNSDTPFDILEEYEKIKTST